MLFRKSIKNNIETSRIYSTIKRADESWVDSEIIKIDGKKPEKFVYSRTSGVYILPGEHQLTIKYSVTSPGKGYEAKGMAEMNVSIENSSRYSLLMDEDEEIHYSLVALPSFDELEEEEVITYFDTIAKLGGSLTVEAINEDFTAIVASMDQELMDEY